MTALLVALLLTGLHGGQHPVIVQQRPYVIAQGQDRDGSITECRVGPHVRAAHRGGDVIAAWNGAFQLGKFGSGRYACFRVA